VISNKAIDVASLRVLLSSTKFSHNCHFKSVMLHDTLEMTVVSCRVITRPALTVLCKQIVEQNHADTRNR